MALTAEERQQQIKEAEELLFSGSQRLGFGNALFFGHFQAPLIFPYPEIKAEEREAVRQAAVEVLSERQQRILQLSLEGWSVNEISAVLKTGPERISDEKYKAIRKLREYLA